MGSVKIKDADGTDVYFDVVGDGSSSLPYQSVVPDYTYAWAIRHIAETYGDTVSVDEKAKGLIKFGSNENLSSGVSETVWLLGGDETYQTTNAIDTVVSDNAGDTQDIVIEGHTIDGSGDFTFVSQTATLNGTTNVSLTTSLARASRIYNDDSTDFSGTVTVFENGGTTHLSTNGSNNQSLKCASTISDVDYYIVTALMGSVNRSAQAQVDFQFQVREKGKIFRTRYKFTASRDSGTMFIPLKEPIIVPPNSDFRMIATSNQNSVQVEAAVHGKLAIIT